MGREGGVRVDEAGGRPRRVRAVRHPGSRRRGQGRETGERQWKKGDRLIDVYMNDYDVPDELRALVMRVVNAREATRQREQGGKR